MKFQQTPVYGFTCKADGIARVLKNDINLSEAFDPASGKPSPIKKPYTGIWDTGATGTLISKDIITGLHLLPSGKAKVHTVGEGGKVNEYEANTYRVNIYLPNNVLIVDAVVAEGGIAGGDVLIGMDIIGAGDFAITNCNGQTHWSFRIPSVERIDFVEEIAEYNRQYGHLNLSADEKRKARNKKKAERKRYR